MDQGDFNFNSIIARADDAAEELRKEWKKKRLENDPDGYYAREEAREKANTPPADNFAGKDLTQIRSPSGQEVIGNVAPDGATVIPLPGQTREPSPQIASDRTVVPNGEAQTQALSGQEAPKTVMETLVQLVANSSGAKLPDAEPQKYTVAQSDNALKAPTQVSGGPAEPSQGMAV